MGDSGMPAREGPITANDLWRNGEPQTFEKSDVDNLCVLSARAGVSDICLTVDEPPCYEHDGTWYRVGRRPLTPHELGALLDNMNRPGSFAQAMGGIEQIFRFQVAMEKGKRAGFRSIANGVCTKGGVERGLEIVMRAVPEIPLTCEQLGIEPELVDAMMHPRGMVLVTGKTGSGKTYLLGSVLRRRIEMEACHGLIYENPPEFNYKAIVGRGFASVSEVPTDIPSYSAAIANSLRRAGSWVLVGEAREKMTIEAALLAAQIGSPLYTTTHANGVVAAPMRMAADFGVAEAPIVLQKIIDSLRVCVFQKLFKKTGGERGRVAIREYLVFSDEIRRDLERTPFERINQRMRYWLDNQGQPLRRGIIRARDAGLISEEDAHKELRWMEMEDQVGANNG